MKTVFYDVDTQLDFLYPAGALYVPGAERIVDTVARLNQYATAKGIPLISTVDAHPEDDVEFRTWKPHCVAGTLGRRKPSATLTGQIIFEKVTTDAFLNPKLAPLLAELAAERYVVYGVVTEVCVRFAALGLLKTGARVELVQDAVKELTSAARDQFLQEFAALGGVLTSAASATAL